MFKKILIPLDSSPLAESTFGHVQALLPADTTSVVLVTVLETYRYGIAADEMATVNTLEYVRSSMEEYIARKQREMEEAGYAVESYLIEGDAAQGILEVAESTGVDLIAMTTHGRSGVVRWALGSVAERVLHYAECPVLLTREETRVVQHNALRTILVPLDGSETAARALEPARVIATATGAELLLLRIAPRFDDGESELLFGDAASAESAVEQWHERTEGYLAETARSLQGEGFTVRTRLDTGDTATLIATVAEEEGADLLVMSTHGRLGFDRLLHGSVASSVLRQATSPLLLVHAPE